MTTVYRKTAKGIAEIETRAHRLAPRLRSALILVDGRRTVEDLATLVTVDPEGTLSQLLANGFIDRTAPPPESAEFSAAFAPTEPSELPRPEAFSLAFEALRREAVRQLTDKLGPNAETLNVKIERSANMAELQPLLARAVLVLRKVRGAAAADAFATRFVASNDV